MVASTVLVSVLEALLLCGVAAFRPTFTTSRIAARRSTDLKLSSSDAELAKLQDSFFSSLNSELGLKLTDFTDVYKGQKWSEGQWAGSTEWWDETKGSKLTGVNKNAVQGPKGFAARSLNVWMGPGFMVPHMMLTIGTCADGSCDSCYSITADYIPRGPVPLGSDQTYMETYFGGEVLAWYDRAMKIPNARPIAPPASFSARLLRSPVCVSLNNLSLDDMSSLASDHVKRWIMWIKDANPVEARQRGAINTRDDKQRQFAYRANVADFTGKIGATMGQTIGACSTGPISEAYIGGGS